MHFFIGDIEDEFQATCHVRAVVDEMDDSDEELFNILVDSGADASIFPVSVLGKGRPVKGVTFMMRRALRFQLMQFRM